MVEENVGNPKRLSGISFMFKTQDYGYVQTVFLLINTVEYQKYSYCFLSCGQCNNLASIVEF